MIITIDHSRPTLAEVLLFDDVLVIEWTAKPLVYLESIFKASFVVVRRPNGSCLLRKARHTWATGIELRG